MIAQPQQPSCQSGEDHDTDENALLTMAKAAATLPDRGSSSLVWRWCRRGLKARNGFVIRLKHIRIGGRVYTTRKWMTQFFEELAAADIEYFKVERTPPVKREPLPASHWEAAAALREAGM